MIEILKLILGRDSEDEIWSRFVFVLVICQTSYFGTSRTQPSIVAFEMFLTASSVLKVLYTDLNP